MFVKGNSNCCHLVAGYLIDLPITVEWTIQEKLFAVKKYKVFRPIK